MTTKSEAMNSIIAGKRHEVFTHETLGCFDITGLRHLVAVFGPPLIRCTYDNMRAPDGSDPFAYIVGQREIDEARCTELTDEQLDDPILMVLCPAGTNGPGETHLIVDGMHRFVERKRRGKVDFMVHLIALEMAPMVDITQFRNVPWGKKDVVPGRGLVDREDDK